METNWERICGDLFISVASAATVESDLRKANKNELADELSVAIKAVAAVREKCQEIGTGAK